MFTLLVRIKDGLDPLRVDFEKHVKNEGLQAINSIAAEAENVCICFSSNVHHL